MWYRSRSVVVAIVGGLGLVALVGCGNPVYQSRYIPRSSQMVFTQPYHELPQRPPAIDGDYRSQNLNRDEPQFPEDLHVDHDDGVYGYHYAGDGSIASRGSEFEED